MDENEQMKTILSSLHRLALSLGKDLSEERVMLYLYDLQELPLDRLLPALGLHEYNYFPSLREIRNKAGVQAPTFLEQAEHAWDWLRSNQTDLFLLELDPTTKKVVRAMGGRGKYGGAFGMWEAREEGFKLREFLRIHIAINELLAGVFHVEQSGLSKPEADPILRSIQGRSDEFGSLGRQAIGESIEQGPQDDKTKEPVQDNSGLNQGIRHVSDQQS